MILTAVSSGVNSVLSVGVLPPALKQLVYFAVTEHQHGHKLESDQQKNKKQNKNVIRLALSHM